MLKLILLVLLLPSSGAANPLASPRSFLINPSAHSHLSASLVRLPTDAPERATLELMRTTPSAIWVDNRKKLFGAEGSDSAQGALASAAAAAAATAGGAGARAASMRRWSVGKRRSMRRRTMQRGTCATCIHVICIAEVVTKEQK